jgi:hydrogenase maturation protease
MTGADRTIAPISIIACGNRCRRDDGVGGAVLDLLMARDPGWDPSKVSLLDAGTDGVAVMFAARGCRRLIVIDACRTGADPGAIFEVPGHELTGGDAPPIATHEFRWDHAIAAGRQIFHGDFPDDVTVFLIEAESVGFGCGVGPRVAIAAGKVASRIAGLVATVLIEEAAT